MNDLSNLKQKLTGESVNEQQQVYNLCAVMEICGGYEQLINLDIPTLNQILKYLNEQSKLAEKSSNPKRK